MGFRREGDLWVPDRHYKLGERISVGLWNQGKGGGRFTPEMRFELSFAAYLCNLKKAGVTDVELHDTEAPPEQAEELMKMILDEGLEVGMNTANLFRRKQFVCGNFGHPDPKVRRAAIEYTKKYIATGIEVFGSKVYVYWMGSSGVITPLGCNYMLAYQYIAECITEIVRWMIQTYGPERALLFAIEPKFNEPPSWGIPADVGEVLSIIAMLPEDVRPYVGLNPETVHSQIGGKRYAIELGLGAAMGKLFHIHLNGGSYLKFDEDKAFGDIEFSVAVETVATLIEVGYDGLTGFDVQPFATDTNDQQTASIERSIRNLRRAIRCVEERLNWDELNQLRLQGNQAEIADLFTRVVSGLD